MDWISFGLDAFSSIKLRLVGWIRLVDRQLRIRRFSSWAGAGESAGKGRFPFCAAVTFRIKVNSSLLPFWCFRVQWEQVDFQLWCGEAPKKCAVSTVSLGASSFIDWLLALNRYVTQKRSPLRPIQSEWACGWMSWFYRVEPIDSPNIGRPSLTWKWMNLPSS